MTPSLRAVYDELVLRAVGAAWGERSQALRAGLSERCGHFQRDHEAAAARDAASMEFALVGGELAREIGAGLSDAAERELATQIAGAIPALLMFHDHSGLLVAEDLWSGASWWIAPTDDVGRDVRVQLPDSPIAQCRLVVQQSGCAVLPGVVFHPADAREPIQATLRRASALGLSTQQVMEALLRMEHSWQTLSRVKVTYAYRADALVSPAAPTFSTPSA